MSDCIFCKIWKNEIPSKKVYEDDNVIGFLDINPIAKIHVLFIHKNHTENINEMSDKNLDSISQIFQAINKYTKSEKLDKSGFRIVINQGKDAGQEVFHTHFHLLAGEKLGLKS